MNFADSLLKCVIDFFVCNGGGPIIFSTIEFWVLFIVLLCGFSIAKRHLMSKVMYLLAFSMFFYYKANGVLVLMMVVMATIDFYLSKFLRRSIDRRSRLLAVSFSVIMNVGVLLYFKYYCFLIESINDIWSVSFHLPDIILPVGISFYVFQSIAYIVDVYKRKVEPAKKWISYMFFVSFFPIIVAGPIMRASKFLPQIESQRSASTKQIWGGLWLLLLGVVKKAVFADYIMQFNNWVFTSPADYTGIETLLAVIGYSAQIYCDFSGYSDMAIGVGAILGYDLGVNFDRPYRSSSITDFWRRWHISLSSWIRDYLYIPMGGSRHGKIRTYLNLFVSMTIAGIWHGASWTFLLWGAMHGLGLIVNKIYTSYIHLFKSSFFSKLIGGILTFGFVTILWPLFACGTIENAWLVYSNMFHSMDFSLLWPFLVARPEWSVLVLLVFVSQMVPMRTVNELRDWFVDCPLVFKFFILIFVIQLVTQFSVGNVAPFIYLNF